jgi:hypothetical protein
MLKQEAATRERQVPFVTHAGPSSEQERTHRCTYLCMHQCRGGCMLSDLHPAGNRGAWHACLLQVDDLMRALDRLQTLQSEAKTAAVHARVRGSC